MNQTQPVRLFAMSDIHVDYAENMDRILNISDIDYQNDCLILAGDVSDDLGVLARVFMALKEKFSKVFYVPGNHELWVRRKEANDSIEKLELIKALCDEIKVQRQPEHIANGPDGKPLWVVPLYSWYSQPEDGEYSLFMEKTGADRTHEMWSDFFYTSWPGIENSISEWMHGLNDEVVAREYEGDVISCSHFLPRQELMFWRDRPPTPEEMKNFKDPTPGFNFSRVAGCQRLETQVRKLGSIAHIYGHQHLNKVREIEGVKYISNCLGYPQERKRAYWRDPNKTLHLVWDSEKGIA